MRILEEDKYRLITFDSKVYGKVREVRENRNTVFNSVVKKETPKTHYLKTCIAEQHLVLPLLDKVRGKTLAL